MKCPNPSIADRLALLGKRDLSLKICQYTMNQTNFSQKVEASLVCGQIESHLCPLNL